MSSQVMESPLVLDHLEFSVPCTDCEDPAVWITLHDDCVNLRCYAHLASDREVVLKYDFVLCEYCSQASIPSDVVKFKKL